MCVFVVRDTRTVFARCQPFGYGNLGSSAPLHSYIYDACAGVYRTVGKARPGGTITRRGHGIILSLLLL